MRIGVIAEDKSDVEVLYELTCKIIERRTFSFKKFVGRGCSMLRRKCTPWAKNLLRQGCSHLVVMHDLDNNDEANLRLQLNRYVCSIGFKGYVILIPVHEIEAWLLVDAKALQKVFNMKKTPKLPTRPEEIPSPKEKLGDIVWRATGKYYVNSIHNKKIAAASRVTKVKTCRSFLPYPAFVSRI